MRLWPRHGERLRPGSVFPLPAVDARPDPEPVNAEGHDNQDEPLPPQAEQAQRTTVERQLAAFDVGVPRAPPFPQHESIRVTDPEREHGDDQGEYRGTEVCAGTAVEGELSDLGARRPSRRGTPWL